MELLSEEDKAFLEHWERVRLKEKKTLQQLMIGLPLGLLFGLPIVLSVLMRGWYKRMPYVSGTQFKVIIIAVLGIAVFYAIFRMRFKWELNEQRYKALLQKKEAAAQEPSTPANNVTSTEM